MKPKFSKLKTVVVFLKLLTCLLLPRPFGDVLKLAYSISGILGLLCSPVQGEQTYKTCQQTQHRDARDDFLAFFKVHDGLDITWLHAVNSPAKLKEGFSGEIMMFEADVLMRNNQVFQWF